MPPSTFLEFASPLPYDQDIEKRIGALSSLVKREGLRDDQLDAFSLGELEAYPKAYPRGYEGWDDFPFLMVRPSSTSDLEVWGHEGRHRANALREAMGDIPYPVMLRAYDRPTWDRMKDEPVVRNQFDSQLRPVQDFVLMPGERYNKGGEVRPSLPPLDRKKKLTSLGMTLR